MPQPSVAKKIAIPPSPHLSYQNDSTLWRFAPVLGLMGSLVQSLRLIVAILLPFLNFYHKVRIPNIGYYQPRSPIRIKFHFLPSLL